jgi:hypothetical protein
MTLTLQTVEAHIRNTLDGDSSVEGNGRSIANQAGHYWASMHEWKCMERLGRLSLRASITISDGLWTEATRTFTETDAFTNYTRVQGDEVEITAGTGATLGFYPVQSRTDANSIVLETSIGSGADAQVNIDGTLALSSVALPSDFRQFIGDPWSADSTLVLRILNPNELLYLRSGSSSTGGIMYSGALFWVRSAAVLGGAPIPRLEIYPPPEANDVNAFQFMYRADWSDMTDDSDVVQIPSMFAMEVLYLQIVRAVALGYEEFDTASMDARIATLVGGPIYKAAITADGGIVPTVGMMRGGLANSFHLEDTGDSWHRTGRVVTVP